MHYPQGWAELRYTQRRPASLSLQQERRERRAAALAGPTCSSAPFLVSERTEKHTFYWLTSGIHQKVSASKHCMHVPRPELQSGEHPRPSLKHNTFEV